MKLTYNPTIQIRDCNDCKLASGCKVNCLKGREADEPHPPLMIFTDHPDYFADHAKRPYAYDTGKFLDWLFKRMSIDPETSVGYEYTIRCYPVGGLPKSKAGRAPYIEECSQHRFATIAKFKPRAVVAMGTATLEAFTGKAKVGDHHGTRVIPWEGAVREVTDVLWACYSVGYALKSPSETPSIFRVLYRAAESAGLKPKLNPNVAPFKWSIF